MAKTRWYNDRLRDPYFRKAKEAGYRARSAYKLMQVDKKYGIFREADACVDLGAAPGGWSQVLVELVGPDGVVVGMDLKRVSPIAGAKFIQGDFTRKEAHERLAQLLAEAGKTSADVVVSDMAPDMSGNYVKDQALSVLLAEMALRFAIANLVNGGHFICKVFEGEDYVALRDLVKKYFRKVYQFHPPASRKQSSEIYLVAKGFLQGPPRVHPPRKEESVLAEGDVLASGNAVSGEEE